ncbi:MAG: hypothetical protein H0T89_12355 [Deltaproteobacteria bacterium]|nr:hypothetical protein [Deltaproteobacteria bacterium]MDQ3296312.1 Hint domain-containing protein [Myxococcota bacterium]
MKSLVVIALFLAACSSPARPVPQPPVPTSGGDGSGSAADDADAKCAAPRPSPDVVCLQDCGPPVVRDGDPEPAWRWATPEQVANRQQFGCPRCLPGDARIATPAGEVAMSSLAVGAIVWSTDETGRRIAVPVVRIGSMRAPGDHVVVALVLADGREVIASPGHPTADARALGTLAVGDALDGSTVITVTRQPYRADRTYDLVPASATRTYWANGVLLASTLR